MDRQTGEQTIVLRSVKKSPVHCPIVQMSACDAKVNKHCFLK